MDAAVAAARRAIDLNAEAAFRVGRASVDPLSRDATFGDQSERLQPQNLKVLIALARKRGKVVTRDKLVDLCWDGRFIGDDVINRAISTLRQFAGRAGGFSIETVPRAGYRLVETSSLPERRLWVIAAVALILLALAATAYFEWPGRGGARPMPTIAVLPFATNSGDPQVHELATDARDAIVNALSQTEFRVRLANSGDRADVGRSDFIVSANIGESSENIVATVRVEDTEHNVVVYSQVFEAARSNAGDLPDRIGAQIAGSLGWTASLLMLERSHPSDPAITAGLFQTNNYQRIRQVAGKAPNSALAQLELAFTATLTIFDLPRDQRPEALDVGRHAMERVRVLAPAFGGTEILWCWLHSPVHLIECEDHLRAGMQIDPDSPWVENALSEQLKDVGRTKEALTLAKNSLSHDPYVPGKIQLVVRMLEATGQPGEAEELYRKASSWWPAEPMIFSGLIYGTMDRGDFEALRRFIKNSEKTPLAPLYQPDLPVITAVQAKDVEETRKLCPIDQPPSPKRDLCMLAFAHLGDNDHAFGTAQRIYPNRIGRTPAEEDKLWLDKVGGDGETDILMGPAAAVLRRDQRFLELARRLGLLAYWRSDGLPDFCQQPDPEPICSRLRTDR